MSPLRFFAGAGFVDSVVFKAVEVVRWLLSDVVGLASRKRSGGFAKFTPLDGGFFWEILPSEIFPHSLSAGDSSSFLYGN